MGAALSEPGISPNDDFKNEGRLAFRRLFAAKSGVVSFDAEAFLALCPHQKGDPRILWTTGFLSELRRHIPITAPQISDLNLRI